MFDEIIIYTIYIIHSDSTLPWTHFWHKEKHKGNEGMKIFYSLSTVTHAINQCHIHFITILMPFFWYHHKHHHI